MPDFLLLLGVCLFGFVGVGIIWALGAALTYKLLCQWFGESIGFGIVREVDQFPCYLAWPVLLVLAPFYKLYNLLLEKDV